MTELEERRSLAALAAERGSSLAALSRMLGRNPAYLQQYLRRSSPRRLEERDRHALAAFFGVDDAALGGVEGDPTSVTVRRVSAYVSAGAGGLQFGEQDRAPLRLDSELITRLNVPPETLVMVRAQGDSMAPGIEDGDELLVDGSDVQLSARPGLFVVREDGVLLVKRVSSQGRRVTLASDNPAYPARIVAAADVTVLGRVVWLTRCPR